MSDKVCGNCRHWSHESDAIGVCMKIQNRDECSPASKYDSAFLREDSEPPVPLHGCELMTREDFGCVLFEAKEE
jgi:hypothetical protein